MENSSLIFLRPFYDGLCHVQSRLQKLQRVCKPSRRAGDVYCAPGPSRTACHDKLGTNTMNHTATSAGNVQWMRNGHRLSDLHLTRGAFDSLSHDTSVMRVGIWKMSSTTMPNLINFSEAVGSKAKPSDAYTLLWHFISADLRPGSYLVEVGHILPVMLHKGKLSHDKIALPETCR